MGGLAAQELARMLEGKHYCRPPCFLYSHHSFPSELERQIRQLSPDFFSEEPDISEDLLALDINYNQVDQIFSESYKANNLILILELW